MIVQMILDSAKNVLDLTLYKNENVYAFCNETEGAYPFGTHTWYFVNDTCSRVKADGNGVFTLPISFSSCVPEEYSCRQVKEKMLNR